MKKTADSQSMLEIIVSNSSRRLDDVLFQTAGYKDMEKNLSGSHAALRKEHLTRRQNRAVDRVLTACTEESAFCCRVYYRQGFLDCIRLLKELGVME